MTALAPLVQPCSPCPLDRPAVGPPVAHRDLAIARDGVLHDGQHREILARPAPAGRVHVQTLTDRRGLLTQRDRQRCYQLLERALSGAGQPGVSDHPRLRHQQRAQLRFVEAGDPRAPVFVELPASAHAAQRIDGDTGGAQRLHVAVHSADRYFQPPGELASGQPAVGLQEKEGREEAIGAHGGEEKK